MQPRVGDEVEPEAVEHIHLEELGERAREARAKKAAPPVLGPNEKIRMASVRHPGERVFFVPIFIVNVLVVLAVAIGVAQDPANMAPALVGLALAAVGVWLFQAISFRFLYWVLFGNSVEITADQYPELHEAIGTASEYLGIKRRPRAFVMHGSGLIELFLIKRFTRRGILVFTSEAVEALLGTGDSRQFMMIAGRQLGHIRAGHFRFGFFKNVIGRFSLWFWLAWRRSCDHTADRIGMLVAGDLEASRRALVTVTVGKRLSRSTNLDAVKEQARHLRRSFVASLANLMQPAPFMVRRIQELESYHGKLGDGGRRGDSLVGFLPPEVSRFEITVEGNAIFGDDGRVTIVRPA